MRLSAAAPSLPPIARARAPTRRTLRIVVPEYIQIRRVSVLLFILGLGTILSTLVSFGFPRRPGAYRWAQAHPLQRFAPARMRANTTVPFLPINTPADRLTRTSAPEPASVRGFQKGDRLPGTSRHERTVCRACRMLAAGLTRPGACTLRNFELQRKKMWRQGSAAGRVGPAVASPSRDCRQPHRGSGARVASTARCRQLGATDETTGDARCGPADGIGGRLSAPSPP